MRFRYRISLLVALAALALVGVTIVTLVLGRRSSQQITGIETRYLPLMEVDHQLKTTMGQIRRTLEDAAAAGEESKLADADTLREQFLAQLGAGSRAVADNGGDPDALATGFRAYYDLARRVSAELVANSNPPDLAAQVEAMRAAQRKFAASLDRATHPDRERLTIAFETARDAQDEAFAIDIAVAALALVLMALLSWQIIRRTVRSLQAVSAGVEKLAKGELVDLAVTSKDELGDLAREANRTARRLRAYREEADRETWVKTGLAELGDRLAGDLDQRAVAEAARSYFVTYTGATSAMLELGDGDGTEVRVTGNTIAVPLLHEDLHVGALSLTMPDSPGREVIDLANRARGLIGLSLRVAESRDHVRALLVKAQTANQELEAFSYSVSHDLRAPLRSIDGFSQALVEDEAANLSPQSQDYLRRIRAAAQRMAELIDDMLRLSRVSRAELKPERVDVSALATSVIAELRRAAPERDVAIDVQDGVTANADPRLIRILLENLLGNAWKFTSKTIAPAIAFGMRDGTMFVRDNGAGFDMKYVERLFGAFQRLHTDKEFPGTGIGLATVQRIVVRHGGKIWPEAAVGKGATFYFTLASAASVPTP